MERSAAPFDRRAALACFDAGADFLAAAELALVLGLTLAFDLAFAAAGRLAVLAFAAALVLAFVFGFPRVAGRVRAAVFAVALGRDLVAGRDAVFRLFAGLAVAFFRAAIPVLKSALIACPLGRRSIWRRPFGSKPKGEKPHNPLKIKELQVKGPTKAGH